MAKTKAKTPAKEKTNHKIFKKRSGRFAVVDTRTDKHINGLAKAEILVKAGLVKTGLKKQEAPAAAEAGA